MRVTSVDFDEDGDVSHVYVDIESMAELKYICEGYSFPADMLFPVKFIYSPETAAELFHRAGQVPGTAENYSESETIYYALMAVVDRLIEYNI